MTESSTLLDLVDDLVQVEHLDAASAQEIRDGDSNHIKHAVVKTFMAMLNDDGEGKVVLPEPNTPEYALCCAIRDALNSEDKVAVAATSMYCALLASELNELGPEQLQVFGEHLEQARNETSEEPIIDSSLVNRVLDEVVKSSGAEITETEKAEMQNILGVITQELTKEGAMEQFAHLLANNFSTRE